MDNPIYDILAGVFSPLLGGDWSEVSFYTSFVTPFVVLLGGFRAYRIAADFFRSVLTSRNSKQSVPTGITVVRGSREG